jgi:hypothetical protein
MSALDHPNVKAKLQGRPPPIPNAVTLAQLEQWLRDWCEPVTPGEQKPTDVEWPIGSARYLRPGPIAEARILGRRPSAGVYGIWSEALWAKATSQELPIPRCEIPQIGCDVARFGDDFTAIHVRCGSVSLHHESMNGWSTTQVAGRLKELARYWAAWFNSLMPATQAQLQPQEIAVKIDADGVGGGVVDQADGYSFVPISGAGRPGRRDDYPNIRSELWFGTARRAEEGRLSLARLPRDVLSRLRMQAMAPSWKLDSAGRRVVEPKAETKQKIGRSPDDMDGLHLAYFERDFSVVVLSDEERAQGTDRQRDRGYDERSFFERIQDRDYQSAQERRGLFGYGSGPFHAGFGDYA